MTGTTKTGRRVISRQLPSGLRGDDQITFRGAALWPELAARTSGDGGSHGLTAKRDIARYYRLLRQALGAIRLTEHEARLVIEAVRQMSNMDVPYSVIWALVIGEDGDPRREALSQKLRVMTESQKLAVVDAAERAIVLGGDTAALKKSGLIAK
jgi:hypothetical protein